MKEYFEKYTSATVASGANQYYFDMKEGEIRTSRAYFRLSVSGEYDYSLLFSGILDGNYRRVSYANEPCDGWRIHRARVGVCRSIPATDKLGSLVMDKDIVTEWLAELSFDGKAETVAKAGLFATDPVRLAFVAGEYLALELTYSGSRLPCHPETLVPVYTECVGGWEYSVEMPMPTMIGCSRRVAERVAFLGDSITQGCGAGFNSYLHWNARLADMIGGDRAFWNLGIGYGTATSAASDGVWLYKAKQNETVFVCYGVNDINSFHTVDEVIGDISLIIDRLKEAGCRVILQTVPPFDYPPEKKAVWLRVNELIKTELARKVELVFDCVTLLSVGGERPEGAKYGGHPNAEGCGLWADALYDKVKSLFK